MGKNTHPGSVLKKSDFNRELVHQIGNLLGRMHLNGTLGFGDLTQPYDLRSDPIFHFNKKFEEGFSECSNHLPKILLEKCRLYYDTHLHLLSSRNKSCLVHRDFRPGNIIVHEGKIQGIIDWAGARASFSEEDFCPLEMEEWSSDIIFKQAFLTGYASIRPVPEYDDIMPLLRLNRAIAVIGFTVKRNTWNGCHAKAYQIKKDILEKFSF
jgi:Ser/Thr protein kinase RdoA (MazF antagonist)